MFFDSLALAVFRSKKGKTFRKKLGVFDYKIGHQRLHKKPGLMDLTLKSRLIKEDKQEGRNRIKMMELNSPRMYGKVGNKGQFIMNKSKIPFLDVPDLAGFKLLPYVSYHTPMLEESTKEWLKKVNDFKNEKNFGRYVNKMEFSTKEEEKENN